MTVNDIIKALMSGEVNDRDVVTALNSVRRMTHERKLADALSTLEIGTRVKVHGISPKRLNGTIGRITDFNRTRNRADIEVELSTDWRYVSGNKVNGIPIVCLDALRANGKENQ